MTSAFSGQNVVSLCPASFWTPKPNLPVTPSISQLPTFAFQSPMMKRTSFLVLAIEVLVGLRTIQLQFLGIGGWGIELDYYDTEHSVIFEISPIYFISNSFVDYEGYSISSKGFLPTFLPI